MPQALPDTIRDVEQLDDLLSQPTPGVIDTLKRLKGDIILLGIGGKMGPSLGRMIRRASDAAGTKRRVIGVSRFSTGTLASWLNGHDIETISCDLLEQDQLAKLPDIPNVVYMAAMKFGSTGQEARTWAMNCFLPGMVAQKYRHSRIVAFSTGNIYGDVAAGGGGSKEGDVPNPLGDYAQSCLGRERMFEHFSRTLGISVSLIRLNYAVELRYGVLVDLARRIAAGEAIDLTTSHVNVVWQGDANAMTIQSFDQAASPPFLLNVAGPDELRVRDVCEEMGRLMGKPVRFTGRESGRALLSNGPMGRKLYGEPQVDLKHLVAWVADWVKRGGQSLGKPTHFEVRDGKF
jgi:dTDP-4-dehydrorhamnose reductase